MLIMVLTGTVESLRTAVVCGRFGRPALAKHTEALVDQKRREALTLEKRSLFFESFYRCF